MIAVRLAELRKNNNWSMQYLANRIGMAKSTYAGYESGYRQPSLDTLQKMAEIFNVSTDYLLGKAEGDLVSEEMADPTLGLWFKELLDAPEERREELRKIWEIIKQRENGRNPNDIQE
ncbi:MAG: helix-turn-helix transcriptional regulator [Paenibacillaceae bacterium]